MANSISTIKINGNNYTIEDTALKKFVNDNYVKKSDQDQNITATNELNLYGKVQVRDKLYISGVYSNTDIKTAINNMHNELSSTTSRSETNSTNINQLTTNINQLTTNKADLSFVKSLTDYDKSTVLYSVDFSDGTIFPNGVPLNVEQDGSTSYYYLLNGYVPNDPYIRIQYGSDQWIIRNNKLYLFAGGSRNLTIDTISQSLHSNANVQYLKIISDSTNIENDKTTTIESTEYLNTLYISYDPETSECINIYQMDIANTTMCRITFKRYSNIKYIEIFNPTTIEYNLKPLNFVRDNVQSQINDLRALLNSLNEGEIIGSKSFDTGFLESKKSFEFYKGNQLELKFENHSNNGDNWHNWIIRFYNNIIDKTFRADNYVLGGYQGVDVNWSIMLDGKDITDWDSFWTLFKSLYANATVNATIKLTNEGKLTIEAVGTNYLHTITHRAELIDNISTDTIKIELGVDHNYLKFIEAKLTNI